jgi:trypsin
MKEAGYRIRLGQEDIQKPGGWEYSIAEVRQHAGYKASNQYKDDIALIRIQRDPKFGQPPTDQVKSIGLFRRPDPWDGQAVWGYGWGKTSEGGSAAHAVLMKVELAVIARPRCSAPPMYDERRIPVTVVCAGAPGRKTCRGDSGGPLVANGQLVGVVSWGSDRCADDKAPGVYTHAGAYAQWIDNVTGGAARAGVAAQ